MTGIVLSPAQHGVWFTERAGLAGTAYHLAVSVTLDGPVDLDALARAAAGVVRAHPQLAGACVESDGVVSLVPGAAPVEVERRDAPGAGPELIDELVRRPFDLAAGPLCRLTVLRVTADRTVLLVVAHHVVFDGLSKDLVVAEVLSRYAAAATGPAGGYAEAVAEVRARAAAALPAAADRFAGWVPPGRVELPAGEHPRAADDVALVPLPAGLPLDRVAAEAGATRFEVLAAALVAVLRRYGNETPTIGVDVDTRPPGSVPVPGMFVNELPIEVPIATEASFRDVVAAVRRSLRAAYAHRYAPVAAAAGRLAPGSSLVPVSISYRWRDAEPKLTGVDVTVDWSVFPGTARGAVHLHVVDGPAGMSLRVQYSGVAGGAFGGHLAALLTAAVAEPDTPLRALALLTPAERAALAGFRGAEVAVPPVTVVDLIAEQVRRAPRAVAVIGGDTTIDYGELADRAGRVATRLRAAGVLPGDVVAVCAGPSPQQVAALLGVLLAGGRYLPLDPEHPADRLGYLLADSSATAVLAPPGGLPAAARAAVAVLPLEAPAEPAVFTGSVGPDDPAYVMYTSGSTGRPKGVSVSHRALVNLLLDMRDRLDSGPGSVWLALTSLGFDISLLELLLPLISGARLVVAPGGAGRDGALVAGLIERHAVTHVQATPSGWQVLLAAGLDEPRLTALAGGEALPLPLAAELRRRVGRLFNVYGPTETTIWSTAWPVPPDPETVQIGAPLANTGAHVLDPDGSPVPVGVPGELYLSGAGLADGYLGRPERTAERFVPRDGVRCYRTGDRVRWHPDGTLEYLGRLDQQIKLRGHRIEPGEVEAALVTHPAVGGAVVALTGEQLTAYLTAAPGRAVPAPRDLQAHLAPVLPRALHPGRYVVLDAFPLTPNGKLDRAALPEPGDVPEPAAAADGPVERILCEVLGRDAVAPDDDLLDLGVHSLVITKIAARFRERLGIDLPLADFFDAVTVADLVAAAEARP